MSAKQSPKFENWLKKRQNLMTAFGILISFLAIMISIRAEWLTRKQEKRLNKPAFSFKLNYNDSTNSIESIDFFSLKDHIHLEDIHLGFPKQFEDDSIRYLVGTTWHISTLENNILNLLIDDFFGEEDHGEFYGVIKNEVTIPIAIAFNYVEDGLNKTQVSFYLFDLAVYNRKVVKLKHLRFQKEIPDPDNAMAYLNEYNDYFGFGKIAFAFSKEIDKVLSLTKEFPLYQFLSKLTTPYPSAIIIKNSNGDITDSINTRLPFYYKDSSSYLKFIDSLNYFKKLNYGRTTKHFITHIDSFMKYTPYCFEDFECKANSPWRYYETFDDLQHQIADLKIEKYLELTGKGKKFKGIYSLQDHNY